MPRGLDCTALTIDELESLGLRVVKTEHYDPRARRSFDLLGFVDLLAFGDFDGIIAVQCTSGANFAARVKKIRIDCAVDALKWIKAGGRIKVYGWRKLKGSEFPVPRVTELTAADFE